MKIDPGHPRAESLSVRERLKTALSKGIIHATGLIAHGRGEAFDYLLHEKTQPFARDATTQAAAVLRSATHPVLSVNGNVAALCPSELSSLSVLLNCPLEVNLFHPDPARFTTISNHLKAHGATNILLPDGDCEMSGMNSERRFVHPNGLFLADVILVPLEDGDRAQALSHLGRTVITIDLNPLSRTARAADITIVDNLTRALPALILALEKNPKPDPNFDNSALLRQAELALRTPLL